MAKRIRKWNATKYEQYLQAGRGQGEGPAYLPWISVQDFSSQGMSSRVFSYKTNRVHHFLSRNELCFFYLLEWSEKVLDIREQYPLLDLELATDVAHNAGIKYPRDNISGFPYILTCDFMITTDSGVKARTVKGTSELNNKRTLEKLEIERRYWDAHDVDWRVVTENEINFKKAKHVEWIHSAVELPDYLSNRGCREAMLKRIESTSIRQAAHWFDVNFGFPFGSGLCLIKHLMWYKELICDMDEIMDYDQATVRCYV